jgi:hypothetical protein
MVNAVVGVGMVLITGLLVIVDVEGTHLIAAATLCQDARGEEAPLASRRGPDAL